MQKGMQKIAAAKKIGKIPKKARTVTTIRAATANTLPIRQGINRQARIKTMGTNRSMSEPISQLYYFLSIAHSKIM